MHSFEAIEREVVGLLHAVGEGETCPVSPRLVAQYLGLPVYRHPRSAFAQHGSLTRIHGELRIYVRADLSEPQKLFTIAHEIGHHVLGLDSSSQANEDTCDAFAARLLVPTRAFERAVGECGKNYRRLARVFTSPESCVALRMGEVLEIPTALVSPQRTRFRGAEFSWPGGDLRTASIPGVRRARLADDRQRLALRFDGKRA